LKHGSVARRAFLQTSLIERHVPDKRNPNGEEAASTPQPSGLRRLGLVRLAQDEIRTRRAFR